MAKQKIPTKPKRDTTSRFQTIYDDLNRKRADFSPTLDLRGKRVNEAIELIDKHIDEAQLLSEHEIRLLSHFHGQPWNWKINKHTLPLQCLLSLFLENGGCLGS